jgi:hypothetical protein
MRELTCKELDAVAGGATATLYNALKHVSADSPAHAVLTRLTVARPVPGEPVPAPSA